MLFLALEKKPPLAFSGYSSGIFAANFAATPLVRQALHYLAYQSLGQFLLSIFAFLKPATRSLISESTSFAKAIWLAATLNTKR